MVWTLIILTVGVLMLENLLDFRSLKRLERKHNRKQCLKRLIRRHLVLAAFLAWSLVVLGILDSGPFLGILGALGATFVVVDILFEKRVFNALKNTGFLLVTVVTIGLAAVLFFEIMMSWLLIVMTLAAFPLAVTLFDRLHGRFIERYAAVVPYFHRMDDAEFLAGLAFSERAYMLDLKALRNMKNAMIVGLFAPRRLYLSKAMLKSMRPNEVEGIVAHEVGHIRKNHIFVRLVFAFVNLVAFIGSGFLVFLSDPPASIAYTMLFSVWVLLGVFSRSLLAIIMQRQEYEADRYAFDVGRGEALIAGLKRLGRQEEEQGDPLRALLHETHPPLRKRMQRLSTMLERE